MKVTRDLVVAMEPGTGYADDVTTHLRLAIRRTNKRWEARAYYETTELKLLTAFSAREAWRIWQQLRALYTHEGTR